MCLIEAEEIVAEFILKPQQIPYLAFLPKVSLEANFPGPTMITPAFLLRTKRALAKPYNLLKECVWEI